MNPRKMKFPSWMVRIGMVLAVLGPGLITASADNDAPGIATYSMVGSTYGYKFLWLIMVITIGEAIIQEIAARMGMVTGKGTADLIRERFGVKVTTFAMFCLLIANLGTTVAEFAGIAAAGELFGISRFISIPVAALLMGLLVLRGSYKHVEKVLLLLCLSAISYVITVFLVKPDWGLVLKSTVVPNIDMNPKYILAMLAVVGTTITPWGIFYMQASVADKEIEIEHYPASKLDVIFGSVWGNVISAFIIIATGATLFSKGIFVEDAQQAALALVPLAGPAAQLLFALGLSGASLLAISVLPLSTTYAISESFGFERGLNRSIKDAPAFYFIYFAIMTISMVITLIPGMPLFQIMWLSQSINAILLPVLLVLVLKLANDKVVMGVWVNKLATNVIALALTAMISVITLVLLLSTFFPALTGK